MPLPMPALPLLPDFPQELELLPLLPLPLPLLQSLATCVFPRATVGAGVGGTYTGEGGMKDGVVRAGTFSGGGTGDGVVGEGTKTGVGRMTSVRVGAVGA